ncbi:MAG: hypothetical protein JWN45_3029 [Acidobacteriaceae bacterium]|nr:hypothetical protein [Acidobacteriaceae bacterium]
MQSISSTGESSSVYGLGLFGNTAGNHIAIGGRARVSPSIVSVFPQQEFYVPDRMVVRSVQSQKLNGLLVSLCLSSVVLIASLLLLAANAAEFLEFGNAYLWFLSSLGAIGIAGSNWLYIKRLWMVRR